MSENEKDNKDFEFIKEQVIEKKRKKIRKFLYPTITNIGFAVLFGATAAITFVVLEPRLYKFMYHDEDTITPVCFPTEAPEENDNDGQDAVEDTDDTNQPTPKPVIVEQSIAADVDDYLSMNSDIRKVAQQVNKSIVNVTSTYSVQDWFGKSVDKEVTTTGVIVYNNMKDLLILVSLDRVEDADSIKVVFSDNVVVDAALQDYESEINLAIIAIALTDIPQIYMNNLQSATLGDSFTVTVGNPVIALGSPNGYSDSMEIGIVTSKGSTVGITDNSLELFNTNIEDNENSDGIIVNLSGEVIGLLTRTLKEGNNKDINTVIGISSLKPIIEMMGNKEPHIYFGVKTDDMTSSAKITYDIINGIYVNEVKSGSPAFDAGIQKGDIILEIDDQPISNTNDFNSTILNYEPGNKIDVAVMRSSGTKTSKINLEVTLEDKAE